MNEAITLEDAGAGGQIEGVTGDVLRTAVGKMDGDAVMFTSLEDDRYLAEGESQRSAGQRDLLLHARNIPISKLSGLSQKFLLI